MPKAIPGGLMQQHVLLALKDVDEGVEHSFGEATGYQLVHDGKSYSPKAVVGLAFKHLTGTVLEPNEFSGGEGTGNANFVLRELGFNVEPLSLAINSPQIFITSRGYAILNIGENLQSALWFNMWQKRMWPYKEVNAGDTLYWYDSISQRIVWKSEIETIERFEYRTKQEVRDRLIARFGVDPSTDPYYSDKSESESGYCIAFKVRAKQKLDLAKPEGFNFPQGGWLRGNEKVAVNWLLQSSNGDGVFSEELESASSALQNVGYFDPKTSKDERERKLREIIQRRGQPKFREGLITAYDRKCAVTRCDVIPALEAAHISPYSGEQSNHVTNGLLLRADIHTLLDLRLIGIEPETRKVRISDRLIGTCMEELEGRELALPTTINLQPSVAALEENWGLFQEAQKLQ